VISTRPFLRVLITRRRASSAGPLSAYDALVQSGRLRADSGQRATVTLLQDLYTQTLTYRPPVAPVAEIDASATASSFWSRWKRPVESPAPEAAAAAAGSIMSQPQGLYLYGDVGTGKSFCMDLFFEHCTHVPLKRRTHFHAFMLDVHRRIHRWRHRPRSASPQSHDPIPPLADALAAESWLLCFDEFQVNDVADAAILHRLFRALYQRGIVVVSTSNRQPSDLYQNGLQRELFLPFIALVHERNVVHCLDSGVDYRLVGARDARCVYFVGGADATAKLEATFRDLVGDTPVQALSLRLTAADADSTRRLDVPRCAKGVAYFSFDELCVGALGAAEYITLANHFHTVFVHGVPRMTVRNKNEARRFIVLIDELYEHRCKLLCSAQSEPSGLFVGPAPIDSAQRAAIDRAVRDSVDDFELMFTGEEEAFMFARAQSRIMEMQATSYLTSKWRGTPHDQN